MLRINRETDYAIRVVLALAHKPAGEIIPSARIRQEMELPESLSLQIISHLAHNGFINTYPGRNGGIQLALPPAQINLHQIVTAFEGPVTISACLSREESCSLSERCPMRDRWFSLQLKLEEELAGITLDSLIRSTASQDQHAKGSPHVGTAGGAPNENRKS